MNKANTERHDAIKKHIEWIKKNLNDVEEYAFNSLSGVDTNDYWFKKRIPLNQEIGFDGSDISLYNFIQYLIEACGGRYAAIRMWGAWNYKEDLEKLFELSKVMKSSFRGKYACIKLVDGKTLYDAYKIDLRYQEDVMKAYKFDENKDSASLFTNTFKITTLDNLEENKIYIMDFNLLRVLTKGNNNPTMFRFANVKDLFAYLRVRIRWQTKVLNDSYFELVSGEKSFFCEYKIVDNRIVITKEVKVEGNSTCVKKEILSAVITN